MRRTPSTRTGLRAGSSVALTAALGTLASAGSAVAAGDPGAAVSLLANDTQNSRLVDVDLAGAATTPFATHTIPGNVVGLTYHASADTVYGISNGLNPALNGIYIFDPVDGTATLAPITQSEPHPIDLVSALAAAPNDQVLYALQTGSPTRSGLWRIDLLAGTFTQLADDLDPFMGGLTFMPDGRLLAISADFFANTGALYEIDLGTASATMLFSSPDLRATGLTVDLETGALLGTFNGFGAGNTIFEIDPATGATTPILSESAGVFNALVSVPVPASTPGDVDGNGVVDFDDLIAVLTAWGPCPVGGGCDADVTGDLVVDFDDLILVISSWS